MSDARRPGPVASWVLAARPRTLPVAVAPVVVGSAVAWAETGRFHTDVLLVALLVALLIQVATNLHNDAADTRRGADDPATRVGPARAKLILMAGARLSAAEAQTFGLIEAIDDDPLTRARTLAAHALAAEADHIGTIKAMI